MSAPLRVLILGGTSEAFALAAVLAEHPDIAVISSLAGRVADPRTPAGEVRIGGFGGVAGLAEALRTQQIDAVVDATHPFAVTMSANAVRACAQANVPLLAIARAPWQRTPADDWREVTTIEEAARLATAIGTRIFVTTGRQHAGVFARFDGWFLIRTIDPPDDPLPARHELLLQRGPFTPQSELRLLRDYAIDVLVSKNSGGEATYAKIAAARELQIPVVMIQRPAWPGTPCVATVDEAVTWTQRLGATRSAFVAPPRGR